MGFILWTIVGVAVTWMVWKLGFGMLRSLGEPIAPTPEPGEMRKINLRYRCEICGAELKMLLATDDIPDAPRHCMDDMALISPIE
jgi:hypothetical protein